MPEGVQKAQASRSSSIRKVATRGAIWVSLISIVSLPLALYRNWILGRIGTGGEVIGTYAVILLFVNIILTFVIFGGTTAVAHFLPKIQDRRDKSGFILSYWGLSAITTAVFLAVILIRPDLLSALMRKDLPGATLTAFAILTPLVFFSQVSTYSLSGLMAFRSSAVLGQSQLFLISILATAGYFLAPQFFASHALVVLTGAVVAAHLLIATVGFKKIITAVGFTLHPYLPKGFWRYTTFVHVLTICSFAYMNIDQVLVLTKVGVRELGVYFAMLQFAMLISFVPRRIGQVLLASFSHLISRGQHDQLLAGYKKLCRVVIIFSALTAMGLVLFSRQIGDFFGPWLAARHAYLIFLAAGINISSIGSINSMLVLSKERAGYYLANVLILISLQLVISLALIEPLGVYGVIIGKIAGQTCAQVGLFLILRWKLGDIRLSPPREYWFSQALVLSVAALGWHMDGRHVLWACGVFIAASAGFLLLIRFHPKEIKAILSVRK